MRTPLEILNSVFHFPGFGGQQERVIQAVLDGRNALAVCPNAGSDRAK